MRKSMEIDNKKAGQRISSPVRQRLLSVRDASAYLGFSLRSVRNLIYSRELPIVRLGMKIFIDIADLDRWIEAKKQYA
jgi:excisionase family DNA binding protein